MIGRHVGAYRILSETGQGGMAVVYLAERADQEYHKRVAIKMVKPGINHECAREGLIIPGLKMGGRSGALGAAI